MQYKKLVSDLKKSVKQTKYDEELAVLRSRNLTDFYNFISRRLRGKRGVGTLCCEDGTVICDEREISEHFNSVFAATLLLIMACYLNLDLTCLYSMN